MKPHNIKGFSLIEVLVFVTILALFFVSAAAVVTASLRNMKINEHKILASHHAEELLEWLRGEKEADWNKFITNIANLSTDSAGSNITDCFNEQSISWSVRDCTYSNHVLLNNLYDRKAWFVPKDAAKNQINVFITVSWQELGNTYSVPLRSTFSIWE